MSRLLATATGVTRAAPALVRDVPGFHWSPAWMPLERDERYLAQDDRSFSTLCGEARRGWYGPGSVAEVRHQSHDLPPQRLGLEGEAERRRQNEIP